MLIALPIFVAGMLMLIAPKYIGAFFNPTGPWTALPICAGVGVLFGHLLIGKIVDIEV
jgi:Flp pilus assembly protein TadB